MRPELKMCQKERKQNYIQIAWEKQSHELKNLLRIGVLYRETKY